MFYMIQSISTIKSNCIVEHALDLESFIFFIL